MPDVIAQLHYRSLDVSAIIEFANRQGGVEHEPVPAPHRAMGDLNRAIATLQSIWESVADFQTPEAEA